MASFNPDVVNSMFEFAGALFVCMSIRSLYKTKEVAGIVWYHPAFFSLWGIYNLFYYPHLEQWYSFYGGVAICICNTIWVSQLLYYPKVERDE